MQIEPRPVADLVPYAQNSRTHSEVQVQQIAASIREFGFNNPVLIDPEGVLIAGHGRVLAAQALGLEEVPTITLAHLTPAQRKAYVIADNQLATTSGWDLDILRAEIASLGDDIDLDILGFDAAELDAFLSPPDPAAQNDSPKASMADTFGIAPFSVLNAREGWWQDRKRAWLARGIQSELGRGDMNPSLTGPSGLGVNAAQTMENMKAKRAHLAAEKAAPGGSKMPSTPYSKDGARGDSTGKAVSNQGQDGLNAIMGQKKGKGGAVVGIESGLTFGGVPSYDGADSSLSTGTSIFDPVLCELSYRWFCPPGGTVLDPFAGGSVRGLVAAWLGLTYIGGDLSGRQIEANREQAERLIENETAPVWVQGDSRTLEANLTAAGIEDQADMILTCPPYADLEVYSDDPADLSNMPYSDFIAGYREAIAQACGRLKNNRFAVVVVGEVRDPKGNYRNFVGDTVEAMRAAGMHFYNEAILITMVGSLPIRAGKQFAAGRKLGKTHQNVLVFVKGDGKAATQACGPVEFAASLEAGPEPDLEPV